MYSVFRTDLIAENPISPGKWGMDFFPGLMGLAEKKGNRHPYCLLLLCDNGHYWTQGAFKLNLWDSGAIAMVRDILVDRSPRG
jgi:hypothetical protein